MTIDKENLNPTGWFTEDHLTDRSATTYDPDVAARWKAKGWPAHPVFGQDVVDRLIAAFERLQGLQPTPPPRPPTGVGLPRYGLRWNGPGQPLTVPMDDGYWTPWHLADKINQDRKECWDEFKAQGRFIDQLKGEIDRLEAENEALRKDAAIELHRAIPRVEIPDFTPGNGNKARRRAEALGIDYDAATRKEVGDADQ